METSTHTPHDPTSADPAHPDPDLAESLSRGHEQRDASIRSIVVFCVVLTLSVVVIQLAVWGLEKLLHHQNVAQDAVRKSSAVTWTTYKDTGEEIIVHPAPPAPNLQPSLPHSRMDTEDMSVQEKTWHQQLHGYGKVRDDDDRAHVPVDKVIDAAVQKGIGSLKATPGKDLSKPDAK